MPSRTVLTAACVAAIACALAAGSVGAGETELDLVFSSGVLSQGWEAAAAPGPVTLPAPVLSEEFAESQQLDTYPLLLGGPVDERLLAQTLRGLEIDSASLPIAPIRAGAGVSASGVEDPDRLVAQQLGLSGIERADLLGR